MQRLYIIFDFDDFGHARIVACSTDCYYIRRLYKKYDRAIYHYRFINCDTLFVNSHYFPR